MERIIKQFLPKLLNFISKNCQDSWLIFGQIMDYAIFQKVFLADESRWLPRNDGVFLARYRTQTMVVRTALGGMVYLDENPESPKKYHFYCPIFKENTPLTDELEAVLNGWFTTPEIYYPLTLAGLYQQAYSKLGLASQNECYGFVPAIGLGGDLYPENLQKMTIKEHLFFLSQIWKAKRFRL